MTYSMERFFLLTFCLVCSWPGPGRADLTVMHQWANLEFVFPNETTRLEAIENGYYVEGNSVPIDVDVHYVNGSDTPRIFVTIPRFDGGRPVTLGTVDEQGQITGYPSYDWHDNQGSNCDGITSVFRVAIDQCSRMWVMDGGKINEDQVCPPQLLAFDLTTDELIYRHKVNASQYVVASKFITPVVDVRGRIPTDCQDTFVYVADVHGFGLLVFDVANDLSWRVTHRLFYPFPSWGSFTIDDLSFELMDGVLGMALSPEPRGPRGDRLLYFHSLASVTENVVNTTVLRDDSFITNHAAAASAINVFPKERPNQAAAEAMDRDGIMYFGLMDPPSIWCWNSATEFGPDNFYPIAINQTTLQFASGVKVVTNLDGDQELWVLTSSFQRIMTGTISSDEINYRIHSENIDQLMENSTCRS